MTQEEKQLLLVDLCGRLPYGVKIHMPDLWINEARVEVLNEIFKVSDASYCVNDSGMPIEHVKPYLFPLLSMTEQQKEELLYNYIHNDIYFDDFTDYFLAGELWHDICVSLFDLPQLIDWLNKNHFDWRGLIPKGLANDATGLNIY